MIEIFTDGACTGNPGKGAYGVILKYGQHEKRLSGGFLLTTNNRMELMAVIVGLEAINKENQKIKIYSDSQYIISSVEKRWVFGWEKKGFKGKKNEDLWRRFLIVYRKHEVSFTWIKGHAGHIENEICDRLAVDAARGKSLLIDEGFNINQDDALI